MSFCHGQTQGYAIKWTTSVSGKIDTSLPVQPQVYTLIYTQFQQAQWTYHFNNPNIRTQKPA